MVTRAAPEARTCLGLALLALAACAPGGRSADAADAAEAPAELVIFVYDRSTSIDDHNLVLARRLAEERIDSLRHGDRVAALQLLQLSLAEPPQRWSQRVPEREFKDQPIARDSVTRARFLQNVKAYLAPFADTADRNDINGTDILSTLHDVAEEMRAYPNYRATLYLFSDMLQSNRAIDMEGLRRMPPEAWAREQAQLGTLPDLEGLCVVVVGARVDNEAAQRVKSFWKEYFVVTGARLFEANYMLRPVKLPVDPCPGTR